jgi:ribulose-phosphate 3-epimerase
MLVGLAVAPTMSIETIRHLLPEADIVDQLAVDAGFPNQRYKAFVNDKLTELKRIREENGYTYEIQVDGGIDHKTAKAAVEAGADVLISGSTLFESEDMALAARLLRG